MAELPSPIFEANKFWAIPLSNSAHRTWNNQESFSVLSYMWDDIEIDSYLSYNKIAVAVAKSYPSYEDKPIFDIATGIYTFSRLKPGDGILGVSGSKLIERTGVVTHDINVNPFNSVELTIKWFTEIQATEANSPIFDESLEIQKMTQRMLEKIQLPVVIRSDRFYEDQSSASYDYQSRKQYLNLEIINELEKLESPKEEKGGKIFLFYGTNRNKTGLADANNFYGDELSELKFGKCSVNIPKGHVQGEIERPSKFLVFQFPEKSERHVILESINELSEDEFLNEMSKDIDNLSEKAAMVFIHGYNTSFAEASRRTAQIAWDIPFNGIAGFYSWPSGGKLLDYLKDIEHADASVPDFEEFIHSLILKTKIDKLHLIAHSMGNRILTASIKDFSNKAEIAHKLKVFNQIVLAAPDLDQNVFRNTILPQFKNVGARRTLYSSEKDKALSLSETFRRGLARLGDAGTSLFVDTGLDTIDASNVKSLGNHHSYIFETNKRVTRWTSKKH